MRIKENSHFHNIKVQSEAASTQYGSCIKLHDLAKIINEGGYTKQQIFNVKKLSIWKKTFYFIARKDKSMLWFKAPKDRLTLLLVTNVAGDLKSMLPFIIKNFVKSTLLVFYK